MRSVFTPPIRKPRVRRWTDSPWREAKPFCWYDHVRRSLLRGLRVSSWLTSTARAGRGASPRSECLSSSGAKNRVRQRLLRGFTRTRGFVEFVFGICAKKPKPDNLCNSISFGSGFRSCFSLPRAANLGKSMRAPDETLKRKQI
jgi:hypothetical protein